MKLVYVLQLLLACMAFTACQRSSYEVWEDTKTCGRHVNRGVGMLGGKQGDSRAVNRPEDFYGTEEVCYDAPAPVGEDFIPLQDNSGIPQMQLSCAPQPRETPGDPRSSIPGIEAFCDPSTHPQLSGVFRNIHYDYNSHLVKGDDNTATIHRIADYLRAHPNTYIFVEGHCDERGPEAYNLALGARRSNGVRSMLISEGVNPDNIFTISYGKERPLMLDHHEESWAQNRRAEFKVYQR